MTTSVASMRAAKGLLGLLNLHRLMTSRRIYVRTVYAAQHSTHRREIQTVENWPKTQRQPHATFSSPHISRMWFQKGANNQQNNGGGDNLVDQSESPESATAPPSSDAMAPATSAHSGGSSTATTRSGRRGHRKNTNDKKSVPVVRTDATSSRDGPNLSTIVEEADESMCSELASER